MKFNTFYKCKECQIPFRERKGFLEHIESLHPDVSKLSYPQLNFSVRNVEAPVERDDGKVVEFQAQWFQNGDEDFRGSRERYCVMLIASIVIIILF